VKYQLYVTSIGNKMPLPDHPNAITLNDIQTEFGGANPIGISEYYTGGGIVFPGAVGYPLGTATVIPSSGTIGFSNFHGAQKPTVRGIFAYGFAGSVTSRWLTSTN
jgi:hypothetical protein